MKPTLFFIGSVLFAVLGFSTLVFAQVNIGAGMNPPPLSINEPPEMAVIPGTYVYFDPDVSADLFFYDGYWYWPYEGYWYGSSGYNGPWVSIPGDRVPDVLLRLPSDYRAGLYPHVSYSELRRNWGVWHRNEYWGRVSWR